MKTIEVFDPARSVIGITTARIFFGLLVLFASLTGTARAVSPDFLVDASWLEGRLKDPGLMVAEVRYFPHRYFTVGHIPGAVQVQRFKDLGDNDSPVLMRLPTREVFQSTLRRWGVNDDSLIVLYDDARSALASRLYFLHIARHLFIERSTNWWHDRNYGCAFIDQSNWSVLEFAAGKALGMHISQLFKL